MTAPTLIRSLFTGPIDVVGDVHGEIDGLRQLLGHLGYDESGRHPERRRAVFLGDLIDRGPDSPAVVRLVARWIEAGVAQCVLGNHDLNVMLGHREAGNHWFFGKAESLDGRTVTPQRPADDAIRAETVALFRTLPLALEREDVRVVHACWRGEMIDVARRRRDVLRFYHRHMQRITAELRIRDDVDPIERKLCLQNGNPVKVITSGLEQRTDRPFTAGGKQRREKRVPWWDEYEDEPLCLFGHFSSTQPARSPNGRAICLDYAAGKRWQERVQRAIGIRNPLRTRLAAYRHPEAELVFDDGSRQGNPPEPERRYQQ